MMKDTYIPITINYKRNMNEAQTRFNKIDPKLRDAGWGIVPGSNILVEQSAYIAPGRITTTGNKNPKKADYILEYKGMKQAILRQVFE